MNFILNVIELFRIQMSNEAFDMHQLTDLTVTSEICLILRYRDVGLVIDEV